MSNQFKQTWTRLHCLGVNYGFAFHPSGLSEYSRYVCCVYMLENDINLPLTILNTFQQSDISQIQFSNVSFGKLVYSQHLLLVSFWFLDIFHHEEKGIFKYHWKNLLIQFRVVSVHSVHRIFGNIDLIKGISNNYIYFWNTL